MRAGFTQRAADSLGCETLRYPYLPAPLRLIVCGVSAALSLTVTVPVSVPVVLGSKTTLNLQLAPARQRADARSAGAKIKIAERVGDAAVGHSTAGVGRQISRRAVSDADTPVGRQTLPAARACRHRPQRANLQKRLQHSMSPLQGSGCSAWRFQSPRHC